MHKNEDASLLVQSNIGLHIDGTIQLVSNDYTDCDIIRIVGDDILVKGDDEKKGGRSGRKDGEWGMGIRVTKSNNVRITGLTIRECWGDCIFVGRGSTNVIIERCFWDHVMGKGWEFQLLLPIV